MTEAEKKLEKRLKSYGERMTADQRQFELDKFHRKVRKFEESALLGEMEEYSKGNNTKEIREKYLKLIHYYHILQLMGENEEGQYKNADLAYGLVREKILKLNDQDEQNREIRILGLIGYHSAVFDKAEIYYERASKVLCQMMITFMDYILQEKGEDSILYDGKERSSYFSLLDEISSLDDEYESCFYYLSSYDFCTEKMSESLHIPEYGLLVKEHERIIDNGLPKRVVSTMNRLREISGKNRAEVFLDIEKAFTPKPVYDSDVMEQSFKMAEGKLGEESLEMEFEQLVELTYMIYSSNIKEI